ncbi:MAG: hypothetical protein ACK515_06370 [bacterium]|jgi:hypothetical protein|nr:MmgE/PrpD family protein [Betaproteobacteria bacterium]
MPGMQALPGMQPTAGGGDPSLPPEYLARILRFARDAAFLNGIATTWHDFDEGSTIACSHPGS